jgi:succinyl-CoA synthetase alpha subunit
MDLLVETTPVAGTEQTSGKLDKAQEAVADAFERAQSAIVAVAESTVRTIGQLGQRSVRPDEMQVTFGLKFSAQGNVIVAGAAGEATLEVALTYRRTTDGTDEARETGGDGD